MRLSFIAGILAVHFGQLATAFANDGEVCPSHTPSPPIVVVPPVSPPVTPYVSIDASATWTSNTSTSTPVVTANENTTSYTNTATYTASTDATVSGFANLSSNYGASESSAGDSGATPLSTPHWELGVGASILDGANLLVSAGRQFSWIRISAEYSQNKGHATMTAPGKVWPKIEDWRNTKRVALTGRYRIDTGQTDIGAGAYVEAGVGRNFNTWTMQPATEHTDVNVGIGCEFLVGAHRQMGMDFGVRFTVLGSAVPEDAQELNATFTVGMLFGKN
jgi:hypothetical protein